MQTLSVVEVEQVSGALTVSWSDTDTDWGSVLGSALTGAFRGGFAGAAAGAALNYVGQHVVIR